MKQTKNILSAAALLFMAFGLNAQIDLDVPNLDKAQVFTTDLIVQGSECAGFDCVNGESFGFDTQRYKENNLRIHFNDTSNSASFPSNDWRIEINESTNGGTNHFAVQDATANTNPFKIMAGAGNHAIFVKAGGNVGMGTNAPVVELHVADGDTPTLRLEQDGSSGFTPQIWDVAGNEANFFVRDVTNGSQLAFKIKPGADENSLFVAANNKIGLGTDSPTQRLDLVGSVFTDKAIRIGNTTNMNEGTIRYDDANNEFEGYDGTQWKSFTSASGSADGNGLFTASNSGTALPSNMEMLMTNRLDLGGTTVNHYVRFSPSPNIRLVYDGGGTDRSEMRFQSYASEGSFGTYPINSNSKPLSIKTPNTANTGWATRIYIEEGTSGGEVGIGTTTPTHTLEVNGTAAKTGGGSWSTASDRRLKKDINKFTDGLEEVLQINPVTFKYSDESGFKNLDNGSYVGIIAQEMKEIAPYMVSQHAMTLKTNEEDPGQKGDYLVFDPSALPYMLINSVKEQQQIIDAQEEEIASLKNEMTELKSAVATLIAELKGDNVSVPNNDISIEEFVLSANELPFVKQNNPNPYTIETSIEYNVPQSANTAELHYYNNAGVLIGKQTLQSKGQGIVKLTAEGLPSGIYYYSLVIDGKVVSTKNMSLQK